MRYDYIKEKFVKKKFFFFFFKVLRESEYMVPMDPRDCLVVWPPSKRFVCAAAGVSGSGGVG